MFAWTRNTLGRRGVRPAPRCRPALEGLEDRCLLSGNVLQTNLVSDLPGVAQVQDPHLVNPWGISASATSPFWVSDNGAGVATLYNAPANPAAGQPAFSINPLVVSIPAPGDPLGASGTPTGTVFNIARAGGAFPVSNGTSSAPATFLFATEDGTIVGWNPGINPPGSDPTKAGTFGIIAKDNSASGAVYKGLAIASSPTPIFAGDPSSTAVLYAANFHSGQIDVFDAGFNQVTALPAGAFTDPDLPRGYAPFNVQELGGKIYVTYAKQDADKADDVPGPGHGFVDVYNLDGTGRQRLVSRGPLDSPWGLALAPAGFAGLSAPNNDPVLLVGNFGNGHINAFDAKTGAFLGGLKDPDGEPIVIDGLWALKVGNGGNGGDPNTVYFTAGLFGERHGLFGSLTTAAPGSPEGPAEAQMLQADRDVVQLDLQALRDAIASGASAATIRQDVKTLQQDLVRLVRDEVRFAVDQILDAGGGQGRGHDADRFGGMGPGHALDALFADLGDLGHLLR